MSGLRGMVSIMVAMALATSGHAAPTSQEGPDTQGGDGAPIEEIVVRADGALAERFDFGSFTLLDNDVVHRIRPTHVYETMVRVPGVWISRGSGQEHLTAIRSAVLTGAGACGDFLFLEDGIPLRPAGFCNVNDLFESLTEQAGGIEVFKGPASALLGGNAVYGAINVLTPEPPPGATFSLEGGSYDYVQLRGSFSGEVGGHRLSVTGLSTDTSGYRDDTGYGQQKLAVSHGMELGGWTVDNTLTATLLNQETGGFVLGYKAYKDHDLRDTNPNPEAYRDAWSWRLASHWQKLTKGGAWHVTPYARRSMMTFLQHFLPGQPREDNDQTSAGALVRYDGHADRLSWQVGGQLEWMAGALYEVQDGPTTGSAFLVETRPPGVHYDYDVDSVMAAVDYNIDFAVLERVSVVHGLRVETLRYDYDNLSLTGNTRDDGTTCGFGGCLYTRPADRDDTFTNVAGRLGVTVETGRNASTYVMAATGFRPPQATELYRLQSGQTVADLDSEQIYSLEAGFRTPMFGVAAFGQRTRDVILRDAEGFNVSDGKTKSLGLELEAHWAGGRNALDLALTYARHQYDFNRLASGGEIIEKGNDVDTAPRYYGSVQWMFRPGERWTSETEVVVMDEYYTNAANTERYEGHVLVNWRGDFRVTDRLRLFARVMNVLDEEYADRADFAFGSHRYFPGMPRQFYLGVELGAPPVAE